ncbi:MAG: hypothetical protein LBK68_04015 [Candidatus Margulisbacteria bacterium]|jgi:hypothetical protein|nr:hypothetical protein [Candidatus Margulisiibacteriota bacterium]
MRYLRNVLLLSLLLTALLPAAWNKLTFQGYVTNAAGGGYIGNLVVGIKIYDNGPTTEKANELLSRSYEGLEIEGGAYTVEVTLSTTNINELMAKDNLYLAMYLHKGTKDQMDNKNIFADRYYLSPNVQILGVPIALKARGVDVKHKSTDSVYEGSSLYINYNPDSGPAGAVVTGTSGKIGIGTPTPREDVDLHVVGGTNTYSLSVPEIKGDGMVEATAVYHVLWE